MSVPPSITLPPGVERTTVGAPSGELAALSAGSAGSRRPVLCVPGLTGSKEDFLPLLPLVAGTGRPVVAVDLRGQFESAGGDDPAVYEIETLARDVAAVCAALGDGAPVHLVGHSFGGLVCRRAVLGHAPPVASLTLLGSGPAALDGQRAALLRLMAPLLAEQGLQAVYDAAEQLAAADHRAREVPAEVQEFLRRRFLANHPVGLQVMSEAILSEPDLVDALAGTGLPVLVAHGEGDDAWPPPVQRHMAERLRASYDVVTDALHSPAAEAPEATAALLDGFWGKIDD